MAKQTKTHTKSAPDVGAAPPEAALSKHEGKSVLMGEESTVYLLDVSSSMNEDLGTLAGERISKEGALKKAVAAMLEARMGYATADKVAIVTFGSSSYGHTKADTKVPLSVVGPEHIAALTYDSCGDTPMYQGLALASEVLAEAEGLVRIVMISDGDPNSGYKKSDIIEQVKGLSDQYGFIVDTVGVGMKGAGGSSTYDEDFLITVAKMGAGNFFPIEDVDQLVNLLKESALERKRFLGSGVKLLGDGLAVV